MCFIEPTDSFLLLNCTFSVSSQAHDKGVFLSRRMASARFPQDMEFESFYLEYKDKLELQNDDTDRLDHLTLTVTDSDTGTQTYFKIKAITALGKVMDAYATRNKRETSECRFMVRDRESWLGDDPNLEEEQDDDARAFHSKDFGGLLQESGHIFLLDKDHTASNVGLCGEGDRPSARNGDIVCMFTKQISKRVPESDQISDPIDLENARVCVVRPGEKGYDPFIDALEHFVDCGQSIWDCQFFPHGMPRRGSSYVWYKVELMRIIEEENDLTLEIRTCPGANQPDIEEYDQISISSMLVDGWVADGNPHMDNTCYNCNHWVNEDWEEGEVQKGPRMSYEEKRELTNSINQLPADKVNHVVDIIRASLAVGILRDNDDEVELDMDALDEETLQKLKRYVTREGEFLDPKTICASGNNPSPYIRPGGTPLMRPGSLLAAPGLYSSVPSLRTGTVLVAPWEEAHQVVQELKRSALQEEEHKSAEESEAKLARLKEKVARQTKLDDENAAEQALLETKILAKFADEAAADLLKEEGWTSRWQKCDKKTFSDKQQGGGGAAGGGKKKRKKKKKNQKKAVVKDEAQHQKGGDGSGNNSSNSNSTTATTAVAATTTAGALGGGNSTTSEEPISKKTAQEMHMEQQIRASAEAARARKAAEASERLQFEELWRRDQAAAAAVVAEEKAKAAREAARKLAVLDKDEAPSQLQCVITQEVMVDPVILAGDGFSYERSALVAWFGAARARGGEVSSGNMCVCITGDCCTNW